MQLLRLLCLHLMSLSAPGSHQDTAFHWVSRLPSIFWWWVLRRPCSWWRGQSEEYDRCSAGCPLLGLCLMFFSWLRLGWAFKISFAPFLSLKSSIALFYTFDYYSDNHFNLVANEMSERVSAPVDTVMSPQLFSHSPTLAESFLDWVNFVHFKDLIYILK